MQAFYGFVIVLSIVAIYKYLVSILPYLIFLGLGALFIYGCTKISAFAFKRYDLHQKKNYVLPNLARSAIAIDREFGGYLIPVKVFDLGKGEGLLRFVRPQLKDGNLDLQPKIKNLRKVEPVDRDAPSDRRSSVERIIAEKLSAPVKEIYCLEGEIQTHKVEIGKLEAKLELARKSSVYLDWAETYVQRIAERRELILLAESIHQECTNFIKEVLIGKELSEADLDFVPDLLEKKIELEQSYQTASDKYQSLKDEVEAYAQLRKESNFLTGLGATDDRPPLPE